MITLNSSQTWNWKILFFYMHKTLQQTSYHKIFNAFPLQSAKDENDSYTQLFLVFYYKFLVSKVRQGNKRKIHWNQESKCQYLKMRFFYIKMFKESIENYYNVLESSANQFNQESFSDKGSMCKSQLHFCLLAAVKLHMQ